MIARRFGEFAREGANDFVDAGMGTVGLAVFRYPVIDVLAGAPIIHRTGAFQLSEMTRDAGLSHAEYFLELSHGKFLLFEEEEKAQPGGIGQETQQINR